MPITLRRTVYPPADNKSNGYNNNNTKTVVSTYLALPTQLHTVREFVAVSWLLIIFVFVLH